MKGRIKSKSKPAAGQTCSLMCNGISSGERNESISPFHKELTRGGGERTHGATDQVVILSGCVRTGHGGERRLGEQPAHPLLWEAGAGGQQIDTFAPNGCTRPWLFACQRSVGRGCTNRGGVVAMLGSCHRGDVLRIGIGSGECWAV